MFIMKYGEKAEKIDGAWPRFKRKRWNREHRLRLLRSFPEEYLSEKTTQLRDKEERALPGVPDWDSRIGGVGCIGSPMSHEQMAKAKKKTKIEVQ